jgi:hypothetical protein
MPLLLVLDEVAATGPAGTVTAQSSATGTLTVRAPLVSAQFSDSFTDTAGTTLQSHTGESLTWANHPATAGNAVITAAGRARHQAASAIALVLAGSPMSDPEYDVEADFVPVTNTGTVFTGIAGRLDSTANTMYLARWNGSTNQWQLLRGVAGTFTTLQSAGATLTANQSYHVKLQIRNATKKVFVDGVEVISSADNTVTAAGSAGVRLFDSSVASDANSVHVDNFTVTPAVAGASNVTGNLTGSAALVGVIPGQSNVTGTETVIARLIGAPAAVSTATGTLGASAAFQGLISAQSALAGDLQNLPPGVHLIGNIPGSSTVTGTATVRATLVATAAATSALTAQATVLRPLTGAITASSQMTGDAGPPVPRWDVTPATEWTAGTGGRWGVTPATEWDVDPSDRWELVT